MNRFATTLLALSVPLALSVAANADVIVSFSFDSNSPAPTSTDANVDATDFTRGPGFGSSGGDAIIFTNNRAEFKTPFSGGNTDSESTNFAEGEFGFFDITADTGFELDLANITFDVVRAGSAPDKLAVFVSTDGGATTTDVGEVNANTTGNSLDLSAFQDEDTLRFFFIPNGNNQQNAGRFISVDNIVVNGTASAIPEPASLALLGLGGLMLLPRRKR